MKKWILTPALFFFILTVGALASEDILMVQKDTRVPINWRYVGGSLLFREFTVFLKGKDPNGKPLMGFKATVVNNTDTDWDWITVEAKCRNAGGNIVGTFYFGIGRMNVGETLFISSGELAYITMDSELVSKCSFHFVSGVEANSSAFTERFTERRRRAYVEQTPGLKGDIKNAILNGKIRLGMTEEQVKASWGDPQRVHRSVGAWGIHQQWVYGSIYLGNG